MTPTQYQFLTEQIRDVKASLARIEAWQEAKGELLTKHDEQLALIRKGGGSAIVLALGLALAWLKAALHL
jgi:hypothetical protein